MAFLNLFHKGLSKTRDNLSICMDGFSGNVTPELLEELEETLILSDVGVNTSARISSILAEKIKHRTIDSTELKLVLKEVLLEILGPDEILCLDNKPSVVLMVGVNGVGKTTTIGKLTNYLKGLGLSVIMGAADTFRAAASEQLQVWAERCNCRLVHHCEGADPASVIFDTVSAAKARSIDVAICDTAGRLHNKKGLMDELAKIRRVIDRELPGSSLEILLVIDATTGQNGLNQAREFAQSCGVTGVVLTKLDGTAKGGIAIAIRDQLSIPIKFVGIGESIEDFVPFCADDYVNSLLFSEEK